jgi:hypothetical protein
MLRNSCSGFTFTFTFLYNNAMQTVYLLFGKIVIVLSKKYGDHIHPVSMDL